MLWTKVNKVIKKMDRIEYLKNIWSSYPSMPKSAEGKTVSSGRIYSLDRRGNSLVLELNRDQKRLTFEIETAPKYSEFLVVGDLVAVIESKSMLELILLAPQLKPMPKRHFHHETLVHFGDYLAEIKSFFFDRGFLEVRTPSLVVCPGTEPSLDVFSTQFKIGSYVEKLFLPTSPELHLKKALAMGADKIFEVALCFRNGEKTERHQPEFLMLEWYRAFDDISSIKSDLILLIERLCEKLNRPAPRQVLSYSVAELFQQYCGFTLSPQTSAEELKSLALSLQVDIQSAETIDDFFFLIFMEKIESKLPSEDLVFVEKYPPYQAALARLTDDGWGDRFEAYWQGMELCNAFHELNDPKIQRIRSEEDLEKKAKAGKDEVYLDEEFFSFLEAAMPPSGGIAMGVERLFMCLYGITQISELRLFPG
jgi:lysyl-tRNA synthetase class 2